MWSTFEHENDSVRKQVKGVQMKLQVRRVQMKVRGVQNERPNERESVQMKQKGKRSKEKAATKGVGLGLYGWDGKSQQRFACKTQRASKRKNININNNQHSMFFVLCPF